MLFKFNRCAIKKIPYSSAVLIFIVIISFLEYTSVIDVETFLELNMIEDIVGNENRGGEFDNEEIVQLREIEIPSEQISFEFCGDLSYPCFDMFVSTLNASQKSIQCAIQDLNDETLNEVFKSAHDRNVQVEIIMDESYSDRERVEELKEHNISIIDDASRNSGSYTNLMHEKFCVIDSKHSLIGSANPTSFGLKRNENVVMKIENSSDVAQELLEEFNQLKRGDFGGDKLSGNFTTTQYIIINGSQNSSQKNLGEFEVVFCPQEECDDKLVNILNSSQKSIYFATFVLTLDAVEEVLLFKSQEDIEVRGLVDSRLINARGSIITNMSRQFEIRKENATPTMHHKLFIVDEEIVIFGSLNPSASGAYYNDENIVILNSTHYARKFVDEFEGLFEEGVSID
ncbi:MAG: phospholipase D-like domain-containing protein [Candidatus Nanoarchaeia archaeon]